ncbi:MAG TPA: cytochrome c maturation protein CcmE [Stellaceae bacterium]|nr:cytochrome c maturation protein CcmE [Stellaceae bacterium]
MTRKRKRLYLVLGGLGTLAVVSGLVLSAMSDNLVFFYSPTDLRAKDVPEGRRVRIGGLVENGSVVHAADGATITFRVTDGKEDVPVTYKGPVPDLFREGQGVVVEGALTRAGDFRAAEVLAKHDENYMPKEVVDALKKSGRWQEGQGAKTAGANP